MMSVMRASSTPSPARCGLSGGWGFPLDFYLSRMSRVPQMMEKRHLRHQVSRVIGSASAENITTVPTGPGFSLHNRVTRYLGDELILADVVLPMPDTPTVVPLHHDISLLAIDDCMVNVGPFDSLPVESKPESLADAILIECDVSGSPEHHTQEDRDSSPRQPPRPALCHFIESPHGGQPKHRCANAEHYPQSDSRRKPQSSSLLLGPLMGGFSKNPLGDADDQRPLHEGG